MRSFIIAALALALSACAAEDVGSYRNALTLDVCTPNDTYIARAPRANDHAPPDHCQGTSNGDNCDDLHSGKIDCIGDGNSGQGDDKKHNCSFPQPGCDELGCCDGDLTDPPADDPPADDPPVDEPPVPAIP